MADGHEKLLPHSVEAEQNLLGGLMLDQRAWDQIADVVTVDDLYRADHRLIFNAAASLVGRTQPPDPIVVGDHLQRQGMLEAVGGMAYLSRLVQDTPSAANIRAYAHIIQDYAKRRRIIDLASTLSDDAWKPASNIDEALAEHARAIAEHATTRPDPLAGIRVSISTDLDAGPNAIDAAKPPVWISRPRLPVAGAVLAAPGGMGKTTLVLGEMVHIAVGLQFYGDVVDEPGTCVYVSAEDGAEYPRYLLQRIIADGTDAGALTSQYAAHAKQAIRIVGWSRTRFGPLMAADDAGNTHVLPVWDLLLELLTPLKAVYVTFDPSVLFGPGERHGNDAAAAFAALMHETAQSIGAVVQTIDHVAQSVARNGIVDQYASRGGTGKVDESRLARQLVRVTADSLGDTPLPFGATNDDIAHGRLLQLHWTKPSYAPQPAPVWLKRTGHWFSHMRSPNAEETVSSRSAGAMNTVARAETAVLAFVRERIGAGARLGKRGIARSTILMPDTGQKLPARAADEAIDRLLASGRLVHRQLPEDQRTGFLKEYIDAP